MIDSSEKFSSLKRNPRKEELLAKQREGQELSREEAAELQGIFDFPDNPRGADLLKRHALGQTTSDEDEELKKHFQRGKFSPEVNALLDRVEAGDSNVKQVARNEGKAIEVTTVDDEKIICTHGLGCCNSVLVYTEHPDGTRNAVLTHYYPDSDKTLQSLLQLKRLIDKNPKMRDADATIIKQIVLFMPGLFKVKDQKTANLLALEVQAQLGAGVVDIKLDPYPEFDIVGKKDQGALIAYIPPKGKGEARYRTWFSDGTLGKQEVKK